MSVAEPGVPAAAVTPELRGLLDPRGIAIIGASPDREIIRGRLVHVLRARGYRGAIYPVTRSHAEVQGLTAYASIADVPDPVDLAIVVIPADAVADALEACGRRGVRAAAIISSGFAEEHGAAGAERQARVRDVIARYGLAVCGPNCEGVVNLLAPMVGSFTPVFEHVEGPLRPDAGQRNVAVVSQSGGIAFAYYNRGRPRPLAFSYLVSTGNEVGLEALDYVDWMLDAGGADVFLLYLETIRTPAKLARVADKAAAAGKPLVVAKVGHSEAGRRAAVSHTAALAGADQAYEAMFRRHGILRADDIDEMLDVAVMFAVGPDLMGGLDGPPKPPGARTRPGGAGARLDPALGSVADTTEPGISDEQPPNAPGRGVAVLTASGGGAVWMADILSAHGLELPRLDEATRREIDALIPAFGSSENPVDVTAQAIRQVGYARIIEILLRSPVVDAIVVVGSLAFEGAVQRDLPALTRVAAAATKPVAFCAYTLASARATTLLAGAGLPSFTSMPGCAKALRAHFAYGEFQARRARRSAGAPGPAPEGAAAAARLAAAGDVLTEHETKDVLAAYGIPRPADALVTDEASAVDAARRLGPAVALKIQSPDIAHKTEAGAIALRVEGETAVRAAYRRILAAARAAVPPARVQGVLVQRMAPPGREMIVGLVRDRDFGPMVMVGFGGIHAEVLRDVVVLPPGPDAEEARRALARLRGAALLGGVRGAPAADVGALVDVLVRVGRFAADHGDLIDELDLNPVIVHAAGEGVSVVDALCVKRRR